MNYIDQWYAGIGFYKEVHTGDIDDVDNFQELIFIRSNSTSPDASSNDYDPTISNIVENWNNGLNNYIHDFDLSNGSSHKYVFMKVLANEPEHLLAIKLMPNSFPHWGWPHIASLYRTNVPVNYKRSDEEISKLEEIENMNIYPNPSSGIFNFSVNSENVRRSIIYDTYGNIINENVLSVSDKNSLTIDLSNHPKGLYFVKIHYTDGSTKTSKILIQ